MVVPNMANHPNREYVLGLMNEKDKIEAQIRELTQILTTNNVGMNDPLVDNEGFPIASIDIYQVRHARHKIICLQNDHKALMKQIENGLHEIYGQTNTENASSSTATETPTSYSNESTDPIVKVTNIRNGSPADIDGIRENDLIVQFGSVNANNFKNLSDIATVAQHSQGTPLEVKVLRNNRIIPLQLTPRTWVGGGLIGCNICLIDDTIDR